MRRPGSLALCAVLGVACATPSAPPRPAQVAVEMLAGFAQRPEALPPGRERVELLVDLTASMREPSEAGPPRFVAAQRAATRLLHALPPDALLGVRALGVAGDADCASARPVTAPRPATPAALASRLALLVPVGESSLAEELDSLRANRVDAGDLARTHVVIVSDLGGECGGDLCASAAALVAGGALLEVVVLGDAAAPECLADLAPAGPPRIAGAASTPARPAFRVESHAPHGDAAPVLLATGLADDAPVPVSAGPATVTVEFRRPTVIGPMLLAPATLTRIRVLDFPSLEPGVREWHWESEQTAQPVAATRSPEP